MRAIRVHQFGAPDVLTLDDIPRPVPQAREVLVRVAAAGVGPWDAWIREGRSKVSPPLPLVLGSDIAGVVEQVGAEVDSVVPGDEIYGVTNEQFCGGYADYAIAKAGMIARKPKTLSLAESATVPVVAVTACTAAPAMTAADLDREGMDCRMLDLGLTFRQSRGVTGKE